MNGGTNATGMQNGPKGNEMGTKKNEQMKRIDTKCEKMLCIKFPSEQLHD